MSTPFAPMTLPLAGVRLIEASAGTGKTYSIASLYLRLLLTRRLGVEQILVVTFTEAATAELHERVRSRLQAAIHALESGEAGKDQFLIDLLATRRDRATDLALLQKALGSIDEAAITTIHGFCHRMLQRGAFESGMPFDLELVGQVAPLVREVLHDFLATLSHAEEPRLVALFHETLAEPELLALAREAVRHREFPVTGPLVVDREQLLRHALTTFGEARAVWQQESAAIRATCETAGFTKEFRVKMASGLLDRLAVYLDATAPCSFILPAGSELLTPDAFTGTGRKKICTATAIKKGEIPNHPFFAGWQRYVAAVAELRQGFLAATLARLAAFARTELPRRLYRDQAQSFDDLLHGLDRALAGPGGPALAALIRGNYPVALIDEFQDTDPVQYRIFQTIYGKEPEQTGLFLIGDPKQAIYAFRGADIFAYLKAAGDAGDCHTMTTNWRADNALVGAVNRLFGGGVSPFLDERIVFSPVSGAHTEERWQGQGAWQAPLQFLALPAEYPIPRGNRISVTALGELMPELVARDIVRLLASGTRIEGRAVRPADIAVLVRANDQAAEVQQALHRHGVAAVLQSRASVFDSHEARELLLLLWAAAEPAESVRLRSALVTDYLGLTAAELLQLDSDEQALQAWIGRFGRWHQLWRDHGFMRFMGQCREEAGVTARLVRYADGLRRLTNLRHLSELIHAHEQRTHCRPLALCAWLAEQCRDQGGAEEAELRLESEAEAVQLVTIHRSKGLQYPVVYCPYLWKGMNHRRPTPKFLTYHEPAADWGGRLALFPAAHQLALHEREEFAENLRLLYVAITRAKHCCLIPWAGASSYSSSALAYLLHRGTAPPPDLGDWFSRMKGFSHAELFGQLARRVAEEQGWSLRVIDPGARVRPLAVTIGTTALPPCPVPAVPADRFWRIGSFSGLTASATATRPEEERDYDEAAAVLAPEDTLASEVALAEFPKGATAGNFFHRVLELANFQGAAPELVPLVAEQLRAFGFAAERWQEPVCLAMQQMFATPLTPDAFALRDITPERRLHELPFLFPVCSATGRGAVGHQELAQAMAVEAEGALADYAARLGTLAFVPLAGYLKGFVDLVFEHQGRWYIVDYKSNHLGDRYQDYDQPALRRAMADHHYYLQYHLYTLALERYLRLRLANYRHDEHFGGVFYLFLKGMRPDSPGSGVFYDRPPAARLTALTELFAGRE
jgi:exodeoxyribonuclease V beta subunit